MSLPCDLQSIEQRITSLVHAFMDMEGAPIPSSLAHTARLTADQAITSSEGGKRLRAMLALGAWREVASGQALSDAVQAQAMLDLACAIEVFQTAALVHDDIIDDADLRRGRPSAHRALEQGTGSLPIGRGLGLMLGDLLATACTGIADDASTRLPASGRLRRTFLDMQRDVEIGQVLDLAIEQMPLDDPAALCEASYEVFRWKTASYTTIAPLRLAFLAGGMDPADADTHAEDIGLPLGVAFQLADDLLDVTSSSLQTGKPVGGDIREGKRTVLLADALDEADGAQQAWLRAAYEAPARSEEQIRQVIALFERTGAIEASRARIANMWRMARLAIERLGLDTAHTATLTALCARFVPEDVRSR
ncbi:polyprenyl synthetase family protein [Bifidobacterium cuniculi]|uniref:Bifunctional short chain isoprenyl diphosphate synthase n=1 Tax=Bifidobacterium cuniculi TaxID=1688 RepID=A0A087B3Q3_9BIFI|nr:polyprenyl synthetase family protein [Bifidobacterium cuniculi]KFI65653.1 bifunctional short chain isoprenyl diphosphate synthase [Bifidobacterium cuniculi]